MAGKYWWLENSNITNTQSQQANKYWWNENTAQNAAQNIVNRVNSYLKNHDKYVESSQARFTNRKGTYEDAYVGDSSSWLESAKSQKGQLDAEAESIISYMSQYSDQLDKKWMDSVWEALNNAGAVQTQVVDSATKDNDYWNSFGTEDMLKTYGSAEEAYKAHQFVDSNRGKSTAELDKILAGMEDGKTKEMLSSYRGIVDTDEKSKYDLDAGAKEIADLEQIAEEYAAIKNEYYNTGNRVLYSTEHGKAILDKFNAFKNNYGTLDSLKKTINDKKKYLEDAKFIQGYAGYMANMDADDFDVNSQFRSTRTDVAMDDARYGLGELFSFIGGEGDKYDTSKLFGDFDYDYINLQEDALAAGSVNDTVNLLTFAGVDDSFLKTMTNDERRVFNYIYKTKSPEAAYEFVGFIASDLKARKRMQEQEFWANQAKESPFKSSVFSTLISPLKGLSYIGQTADMLNDGKIDQNAGYNRFSYIPSTIRSQVSSTIENSGKWGKVGSFAYNTGMSMADFVFTTAVSGGNQALSLAIMGTGAAADATLAAKDRGLSDGQAFALGTIAGLAEIAMEKISLGAWLDGDMTEGALKYWLSNTFSEGLEETGTSAINLLADVIIAGDKSEWKTAMQDYIDRGIAKTEAEAFGLVAADQAKQMGLDALGGMLSGSTIGGGTYAGASVAAQYKYGGIGKNANASKAVVSRGLELAPENKYIQKLENKLNKGKNLSGMQVQNVLDANQRNVLNKSVKDIQEKAKSRLQELGEKGNVDQLAELAAKKATGQELTRAEKRTLVNSSYGSEVAKWAEGMAMEIVDGEKITLLEKLLKEKEAEYKPIEERVAEGEKLSVSKSGQAVDAKTGNDVNLAQAKVTSFVKGKDGKIADMVLEVDGKEVKASEIEYANNDQAYLYYAVTKMEHISPRTATTIINDYNPNSKQSVSAYLNGIDEAFNYGYYGYAEEDLEAGKFAQKLTDKQKKTAYELGKLEKRNNAEQKAETIKNMRTIAEANAEKAEAKKAKQMSVRIYGKDGKLMDSDQISDAKQAAGVEVAKILHQLGLGTNFEFYTSYLSKKLKDKDGNRLRVYMDENGVEHAAPAGLYKESDGTIRVDLNAYNGKKLTLNVLAHELTHFVQQWSTEKYQVLADFLIKTYEDTSLTMHQRVIREQNRLENLRGTEVSYEEAFDEVVANAMMKMFDDGKLVERLTELKETDKNLAQKLWEGIKEILSKFFDLYEKQSALFFDTADLMEMHDAFEQLQDMFAEALVEASENFQASLIAKEAEAISNLGENAKVETNEAGELLVATNESGNVVMYSEQTYLNGGRDKLEMALRQNGHTEAEIENTLSYVDDALDYIKILAAGYAKMTGYNALSNHLVADIITNVKTGKQVMSSIVNNGDYPVNIDLSLICKKRVAYMHLMSRLIQDGVFDKVNYDGSAIAEVNEILRDNGFETACLGCFVESRRLQFQTWAETIVAEWNAEVDKRNPNAENFGFAKGKMEELTDADINALTRELESVKKNAQGNVNLGKGDSVTKMGRLMDTLPSLQKKLTVEDLLTPEGLTALRKHDGSLFSVVKSRYGAASPKIVQDFNPYASEIAMLTFAQVKNITSNAVKGAQYYVTKVKNEYGTLTKTKGESDANFKKRKAAHNQKIQDEAMRRYLYDIGGARIQSFSDFMIENIFDYIQIFADLAAKRLPLHGYTKEIVCLRLFGMTGAKWNGSLIAHVERSMGKEFAGLLPAGTENGIPVTVDGKEYVIGFDDYARNAATNGKSFIQSIGMKDIIALQLDPRYSPYVGNITIGVSDAQILAMLDSPLFRMVIPYHASGMLPMFAKLVGVDLYNDYTDYQNTTVRQYYDKNGNAVSELRNSKDEIIKADTSYAFNAEIQKTKDAKVAANNYLKWCAQRHPVYDGKTLVGYATFNPKFSSSPYGTDFTRHENYYKLLEDFNTYDCVTEQSAIQGAVTMTFPSEENRLNEEQMEAYKAALRETGIFTEEDIAKYAKNADMTFKEIIDAEVGNRAEYAKTQAPKWESTVKKVEEKLQKDYAREMQASQETDADRITMGMTDTERAAILKKKSVVAEVYKGQAEDAIKRNKTDLESDKIGLVKSALVRIGEEFRVFTDYNISDVDVKIRLSKGNIKESVSKEITPTQIAKLLPVLKIAVENAVGIESHVNRYFYDNTTVYFENLLGGYVDGEYFVPVRFGLKHSTTGEATLYVIVDQQPVESKKIKAEVVKIPDAQSVRAAISRSAFKVSIANLAGFVNGKDLLRYLPDDMLSAEQKKAKWEGIAETVKNTAAKNDKKYKQFIADGNINAAQRMVDQAAKAAGYTIKAWHGSRYIFDKFSKERQGSNTRTKASYGWFFAGDKETANSYYPYGVMKELAKQSPNIWKESDAENMKHKGKLYSLYLKMKNPLIVDVAGYDYAAHTKTADAFMEYVEQAERNGNDGIILYNVRDNQLRPSAEESTVYMFRDPSQAKYADPITYDEQDNIVPISERFNDEKDELRYSTQETDNISNRELLANAFETLSRSSVEYEMIQDYKKQIKLQNMLDEELSKLNEQIHEMKFTKGKYDAEKIRKLEEKAERIAKDINKIDMTLVNMETAEPLRKLIQRERKIASEKTREHIEQIQQNKKDRAERTELRHKIRKTVRDLNKLLNKGDKKKNVKEGMRGFVSKALELADYLFTDHISNDDVILMGIDPQIAKDSGKAGLIKRTEDILNKLYYEADSLTDEEFIKLDEERKKNEDALRDVIRKQRNKTFDKPVYQLFDELITEYAALKDSNQEAVKGAYDPKVEQFLRSYIGDTNGETDADRKKALQNMRVADMTTEELWKLHNAYTMVLHSVKTANEMFASNKKTTLEKITNAIANDFSKHKNPETTSGTVVKNIINKLGWNYEKLYYALDRIGSDAFTELFMNLADSENTVMQDIIEAVEFRDDIVKKYGFNDWLVNKKIDREFVDNTGKKFKLTLGELMSLYAYSRRKGAWDHIEYGGFVFGEKSLTNSRPADSYKLTKEQCEAITDTLTAEQKAYVEDMQKFLSETMGAKGNEVSMLLYGIKLFGEENYFPIHIAGQYKAQAQEAQAKAAAGFGTMSNAGFTHAQNPNAKAPFVLEGFNEIWSDHVNEMSRYHGTVPALEDIRRVMNHSSYINAGTESASIKAMMENAFGQEAVDYFDSLYREANSGAITDKMQAWPKKLLSLFRKNSVAYSLSVIIQQPSAMNRAFAMIDRKYFGFKGVGALTSGVAKAVTSKWNPAYANAYNEMLKYAPGVTMAKEIGGFDTHTGTSIREYLLDTNKSFKQSMKTETLLGKGKAALGLVDDNAIANLPSVADKIAWIEIWNACKRETVANHKDLATNSEEFMKIVGNRFTEVIRATQVYDSMFSKSPMLKSKSLGVQYLVSFMNEPNTTANMVEKAARDIKKGDLKGGLKIAGSVVSSIVFNNVLKAVVYAMRDDDEDETYIEKYISAISGGIVADMIPISYIPYARDVMSKIQGYDVERPDMAIITDAIDAYKAMAKLKDKDMENMTEAELEELDAKMTDASWKLVGSIAAFLGIPVKNVYRDVNAVIKQVKIASKNAGMTTSNSFWDKVEEGVLGSLYKDNKGEKLYDAIVSGDEKYVERIKGTYKTNDAYNTAVRKALRENDPRIHDAAQARYDGNTEEYKRTFREILDEGIFSWDEIMDAVNSEVSAIEKKANPDKATSNYSATDYVEAITKGNATEAKAIMDDIITTKVNNGKTQAEAEKEFKSSVTTGVRDAYASGLLNNTGAENMLIEYADMDEEDAESRVNYWTFCEDNPEYESVLSESNVNAYQEHAEPAGVSVDVYAQFVKNTKGLADIKDKYGDVEVSKRDQVLDVIDSLPITRKQKDAMYLAAGYAESKIWDVPW